MEENRRTDKWLWCVRIYKTRSLATDACKGGKIKVNGDAVKPARTLKPGDIITFRQGIVHRSIEVVDFPSSRVGAALVVQFMKDLTPEEEYQRAKDIREYEKPFFHTGKGRPTKKDRRKIDSFKG